MAKAFTSIKTKTNLYDFLSFGKFKGCRIDSLLVDEYEYLQYLKHNKIVIFDESVLEALEDRLRNNGYETKEYEMEDEPSNYEDVPW